MSEQSKREYLDYWYSLNGNLGCTKSFGLKVWMKQQEVIDEQFEMLKNQANTILDYQNKVKRMLDELHDSAPKDVVDQYRKEFRIDE